MKLKSIPVIFGMALVFLGGCGLQGSREQTTQSTTVTAIQSFKQTDASTSLGKTHLIFATGTVVEHDPNLILIGKLQGQVTQVIPNLTDSNVISGTQTEMLNERFPVYFSTESNDSLPTLVAVVSETMKKKLLHSILERSVKKITLAGIPIYEQYRTPHSSSPNSELRYYCNLSTAACHYDTWGKAFPISFEDVKLMADSGTVIGGGRHSLYYPIRTVTKSTTLTATVITVDPEKRKITIPASTLGSEKTLIIQDQTMVFPVKS